MPPKKPGEPKLKGQAFKDYRLQLELDYAEKSAAAVEIYDACIALINEMREKEILIRNGEELDEEALRNLKDAKDARENIRANRLARYEEMARSDERFQQRTSEAMSLLVTNLANTEATSNSFLALLERLVTLEEKRLEQIETKN